MVENKSMDNETARAIGLNVAVSTKDSIEIADFIRRRGLDTVKRLLERVLLKHVAVPMKQFNKDTGHRPSIGPGRYPIKAVKEFLMLLESAEANAKFKNMDVANLYVANVQVNKGSRRFKGGRQRRRLNKSTNLEVILKVKERKNDREKVRSAETK